jgi:hypothetical protein
MADPGTLDYYLDLITSAYSEQPNAMATVKAVVQPKVDLIAFLQNLYKYFQLDTAVGDQLDKLGAWIGASRNVTFPLTGVYFSLDSATLGLDQGSMQGKYDPDTGLVKLPDDVYLKVINLIRFLYHNRCTIPKLHEALDQLYPNCNLIIQNNGDLTVFYGLTATPENNLITQLFLQGYLSFAPAGCNVVGNIISSPDATPIPFFGLDYETIAYSGLDVGYMV